jgi:hypothetical protein
MRLTTSANEVSTASSAPGWTASRQPKVTRDSAAHQHRHARALRLRTRHQRGLQAAHVDRDKVMGSGVHEPTDGNKREASEALLKLAAGRLSLHSPTHSVLARTKALQALDSATNLAS